jgi:tetratricopeptide (TPR) repeat protein
MSDEPTVVQILRSQQDARFVGRLQRRLDFLRSLQLPAGDPDRRNLFNVHGDAGIGKTSLTQQLRRDAEGYGAVCAYTDEHSFDVPQTMAALARDLARSGFPLKRFDRRFKVYQDRRDRLEADPQAPPGAFEFVTRMAVKTAVLAAKNTPVVSFAADLVDPAATAEQAERLRAYLVRKFRKSDEVRLLLSPAGILTPLFVEDLTELCRQRSPVLLLDTFEKTSPFLESWLADLFDAHYGAVPGEVTFVVSGQRPLDGNRWIAHRGMIEDVALTEFDDDEARELLGKLGVRDSAVEETILELAAGLPLLLAMLASNRPTNAGQIGDHTGDAVERFLKWVDDPDRKETALAGALPRTVNQDIFLALGTEGQQREDFHWLLQQPFVTNASGACTYHGVVRGQMLKLRRTTSPVTWNRQHLRLAETFSAWRSELSIESDDEAWADTNWPGYLLEEAYHRLCAARTRALPEALRGYLRAAREDAALTRKWARMIADAGRDADNADLRWWGRRLEDLLDSSPADSLKVFDELLDRAPVDSDGKFQALRQWADYLGSLGEDQLAVDIYSRALAIKPADHEVLRHRGETYRILGDFARAIADFDRALELDEGNAWILGSRGQAHASMGDKAAAMTDLSAALSLDPALDWALVDRARLQLQDGQPAAALLDFDRALEINPDNVWILIERAEVQVSQGDAAAARADLNRAAEVSPDSAWPLIELAGLDVADGDHDSALAKYGRALELGPDNDWVLVQRAEVFHGLGRYAEELADLDRAIDIDPMDSYALANRAVLHSLQQRPDQAKKDFDRAIEIDPSSRWAIRERGELHLTIGAYEDAVADYSRLIDTSADDYDAHLQRCDARLLLGQVDGAAADIEAIRPKIETDDDDADGYYSLGLVRLRQGQTESGRESLRRAVSLAEKDVTADADSPAEHLTAAVCNAASGSRWEATAEHIRLGLTGDSARFRGLLRDHLRFIRDLPGADREQLERLIQLV